MKTLLFGSNGYVGATLQADIRVSREQVNLLDYDSVLDCIRYHNPTHIICSAALHGSFQEMSNDHSKYLRTNLMIDSNVLEASRSTGIQNVLMLSSISGLPESTRSSNEDDLSTGPVSNLNFGYNFSKYASTQLVKSFQLDGFVNYKSLLLGNIYGYNEKFSKNTNVVATLVKNMYKAKLSKSNLELYGNGLDGRCLTHLKDISNIIQKINAIKNIQRDPIIVSTSKSHTIAEIAQTIAASMNFQGKIIFSGQAHEGYTIKNVNNSRLIDLIGQYDFIDLKTGIDQTVNGFISAQAISRDISAN